MADSATVTLLFTDLVGSTELLAQIGDDAAEELRRIHFGLLREAAAVHGGEEVKSLGDGLMVAFPSAFQAVACAVGMQQRVSRYNTGRPDRPLGLRVGLNVGEAISDEHDYFGTPVVVAKRLCDRAGAGDILLSALVRGLVGSRGGYDFRDLGPLALKGLPEPVATWQLAWQDTAESLSESLVARETARANGGGLGPVPLQAALAVAAQGVFVGREGDLARLRERFRRVTESGALEVALVTGEPGIGKTRLAAEFAREGNASGAIVLFGRCDEETLVPYQPFVEMLGHWVAQAPLDHLRREVDGRGELLRLLPEVSRRVPGLQRPLERDPETERYRLFESVVGVLRDLAAAAPVVLVLDDLHWVDKPTALLVRHVARSCADAPLLLVGTYRSSEVGRAHPIAETVTDLRRQIPVERLPLRGLAATEVTALIARLGGAEPAPALAVAILRETEGNPFFVAEVVDHLMESDALIREDGVLVARGAVDEVGIPDSIKGVIDKRLAKLGDPAREMLSVASVVGREFGGDLLGRIVGGGDDAVADALDEALAAGVIDETVHERYAFAHTVIRQTLYEELSRTRRLRLHHQIADTLEALYGVEGEHLAEIAHHYAQAAPAGDADKAVEYAIRAGRRASDQLAYEEAAAQYERALHVLDLKRPDALQRCELLLACGEAEWNAGEFERARAAYRRAAALAEGIDAAEQLARAALGFRGELGYLVSVIDQEAIGLLRRALGALDTRQTAMRARVLAALAETTIFTEPLDRRCALAHEAIETARRAGDQVALAEVLVAAHWGAWGADNVDERKAWAEAVAQIGDAVGDPGVAGLGRGLTACDLVELGDVAGAAAIWPRALDEMRESGHRYLRWLAGMFEAGVTSFYGDFEGAERLAEAALSIGQQAQNQTALQVFGMHLAAIRKEQGRLAELEPGTRAFLAQFPTQALSWRGVLAAIYAETGQPAEARRELDRLAQEGLSRMQRDVFYLPNLDLLAWTCNEIDDARAAQTAYDMLEPYAGRRVSMIGVFLPTVDFSLGRTARVMGRWDDAARHFEAALQMDADAGTYFLGHTQREYARALLGRRAPGDRERALELLDQAQETAERFGMPSLMDKIRATRRVALGEPAIELEATRRATFGERLGHLREDAGGVIARGSQTALAKMIRHMTDAQIERRFGTPSVQRALFTAMAQSFQPSVAHGFEGDILYELTGAAEGSGEREPDCWTVAVHGRRATAHRGRSLDPALVVRLSTADFVRIVAGELNPVGAMVEGRTDIEGDLTLAVRLVEMFGGVVPEATGQTVS